MLKLSDPDLAKLRFECYREALAISIRLKISGQKVGFAEIKQSANDILSYALNIRDGETVSE